MPLREIKQWVTGGKRHAFYDQSIKYYKEMKVHSDGEYPEALIGKRRPAESIIIKDYRKEIYSPITVPYFSKVSTSLSKIRKSQDYAIQFISADVPHIIAKDETLENYTVKEFPKFTSLDNWFWSVAFKQYLIDPGAVILTSVLNKQKKDTEYYKPYPVVYNSDQILDYKEDDFYFLKSNESYYFQDNKGKKIAGNVFYYIDGYSIDRYEQRDEKGNYSYTEYVHGLEDIPITKLFAIIEKDNFENILSKSRLASMLPELNEAVREYSDLQAEVVQHIHSTMWALSSTECKACKGTGLVKSKGTSSSETTCSKCNGEGSPPFDPYKYYSVKRGEVGAPAPPTPPAGYITKQIDIAKLQDTRVQDHIFRGLSAINYEWMMSTPLNVSGKAKEIDRSELNNFVYSIAEDCIRIIDELFELINDYRYSYLVPDESKRDLMLPKIEVPTKYDIVTDQMMSDDLARMRTANFNQKVIAAAEVEYIGKKFITDPELKNEVLSMFELDPFSGINEADIVLQLTNKGISMIKYTIHCNIKDYIEMAIDENPDFLNLPEKDKRAKMEEYAKNDIKNNSASGTIMTALQNANQPIVPPAPVVVPAKQKAA